MSKLFNNENSDSDGELQINNGYANNYNNWRQKEELNKLKTKYGEHVTKFEISEEDSETSSDEDEEGAELTEEIEKNFYKTLACLKNKDPKIYDEKVTFFEKDAKNLPPNLNKKLGKKEKKVFLRDYERQIVLEKGGKLSDSEDEETFRKKKKETRAPTYVEEQLALKESIAKIVESEDEDEENDLLVPKLKTETENLKDDESYKEWLKGQKAEIENHEKEDLKPLRDFWNDPNLEPNEKFLRDYVLNKKFLSNDLDPEDNLSYEQIVHDSDENLSEDERNIEKQEEFEHKYNFRFEEPDQEFLKRYPRTLENSLRKKDNRRAQKRAEIKKRKEADKIRKQEELKQLKALKRKEIADKIAQLKEITGNDDVRFDNIDLDGDFDPAEHDRKMQEIFNEEYYAKPEDDTKPEFPDIDEELGIEKTWDDYDPGNEEIIPDEYSQRDNDPHCEDPQFNMDADYDPTLALQNELIESSRKKKKRRRSKFAEIIAKEKPKFDPNLHSSYRDYIEQYYALDYEDMIDDLPCRFKYRKVVPNDYGLTVEEILMADDRELNKWCSLKKALEHKPETIAMNEVRIYQQKSKNEAYKKKVLKSLYEPEEETQDPETMINPAKEDNDESTKKKRKRKKKKEKQTIENLEATMGTDKNSPEVKSVELPSVNNMKKNIEEESQEGKSKENMAEDSKMKIGKKRKVNKKDNDPMKPDVKEPPTKKSKNGSVTPSENKIENSKISSIENEENKTKKKKKNAKIEDGVEKINNSNFAKNKRDDKRFSKKNKKQSSNFVADKKLKKTTKKETDQISLLSSERLKAYGINPKKFKNQLKYGKQ